MEINPQFMPKVLELYLEISRYPVLCTTIRERMRKEMFKRGIISEEVFENEVIQKSIESQRREGLVDPYYEESAFDWSRRTNAVRDNLTDFYFAYNLPHSLFEKIVQGILAERVPDQEFHLSFNPEVAPWDVLLAEGERFEAMPDDEQERVQHHLRQIKAVLIKTMISDHINFIRVARETFSIADLKKIRAHRMGRGKIGGKAAGMLLAWKLLQKDAEEFGLDVGQINIPVSYYVGSDVFYDVHELNGFYPYMNQKYKSQEEIIADYPTILERYTNAQLPEHVIFKLRDLLEKLGRTPLIFRSSSLLEDNFDTSFAGKYDSFFVANQGTLEENLQASINAILRIYASTLSPDALIYRKRMNLIDFDERMAILIQKVEGQRYGDYYFPAMAGVGFSRNPFRWTHRIRREDGLLRLVCGLGTRAVDRVANDYPRMIGLSHPHLRPETTARQLRQYSQRLIDVLDMNDNEFKTLPISEVIDSKFPALRLVAVQDTGDQLRPFIMRPMKVKSNELVFTFKQLVEKTAFPETMRGLLGCLQQNYGRPVDIEYAVDVYQEGGDYQFIVTLLQCRPLSQHEVEASAKIPDNISDGKKLFTANRQVPEGIVERIQKIVLVKPGYNALEKPADRLEVGRVIGRLNKLLEGEQFILMGPGRWGSSNIQLGVKVSYADIYNSRALIEIALPSAEDSTPEMAYGTHFFQDLVESKIFPLALFPSENGNLFNWGFFENAPNMLPDLLPSDADMSDIITVIDVPTVSKGRLARLLMNTEQDHALCYLERY